MNRRIRIVVDDKIPYIEGVMEACAEVSYLPGKEICPSDLQDVDALLVRTRTECNAALLEGTPVRFIATATIGYDHIDTTYCKEKNIHWVNAPGCNADSVEQYVSSALLSYAKLHDWDLSQKTLGVVGLGHVGTRVAAAGERIGMKVLCNDPPRSRREGAAAFVSLQVIQAESDIISFHVPLQHEGVDATYHMVNEEFIRGLARKPLLLNTCRGEVFDTTSLIKALKEQTIQDVIVDCWEDEPHINRDYLALAYWATPHIAGYSRDGKYRGTQMVLEALIKHFDLALNLGEYKPLMEQVPHIHEIDGAGLNTQAILTQAIQSTYSIEADDQRLRAQVEDFEKQRAEYPARREYAHHLLKLKNVSDRTKEVLRCFHFRLE